jgi:Flp pilus assembly protein TadD
MGIHFDRGQALFELERYEEALVEYQLELAEQPRCVRSKTCIAQSLLNLKRATEARQALSEALALAPEHSFAYYLLSFLEPHVGRESKALAAIGEAIRFEPRARYFCRLGFLLRAHERHAECLEATDRALELDPRHVDALVLRAWTLHALRRFKEATATLQQALKINPNSPDAYAALGTVALATGDSVEALDLLREARRISPVKHHQRGGFIAAYSQRIWPFHAIDALVRRYRRLHPWKQWALYATSLTALMVWLAMLGPTSSEPPALATTVMLVAGNLTAFLATASAYPRMLVRLLYRRELQMSWANVIKKNVLALVTLAGMHAIFSGLAVATSATLYRSYVVLSLLLNVVFFINISRVLGKKHSIMALAARVAVGALAGFGGVWMSEGQTALACLAWMGLVASSAVGAHLQEYVARHGRS